MNWEVEELARLRRTAHSLLVDASRRRDADLAHWNSVERPALKEQAAALKSSEAILLRNVRHLEKRLESHFSQKMVDAGGAAKSKVLTGFNPIQSRAGPDGAPLPLAALEAERDRLRALAKRLEVESAECRAEMVALTPGRREREAAVWETRLIALADTLRVVLAEVAAVEVELAGREAAEKLIEARKSAEASGAAALHRARADAVAARVAYNRARRRLHFPDQRGYNITFGGAGVYGATKDICISELRGSVRVELRPPERPGAPATFIMEGSAPRNHKSSRKKSGGSSGSSTAPSGAPSAASTPKPAPGKVTQPTGSAAPSPAKASSRSGEGMESKAARGAQPKPAATASLLDALNSAAGPSAGPSAAASSLPGPAIASNPPGLPFPAPIPLDRAGKPKKMALKFLARLGSKRDKYQAGPEGEEVLEIGKTPPKTGMRSLASKLLGRKSKSQKFKAESLAESSPMGSLAFGEMSVTDSIHDEEEEEGPPRLPGIEDEDLPTSPLADLAAALQHGKGFLDRDGDGSLASGSESESGERDVSPPRAHEAGPACGAARGAGANAPVRRRTVSANSMGRGGWLRNVEMDEVEEEEDDDDEADGASREGDAGAPADVDGIFVRGRTSGFELVGEKGSKVPNLCIGQADVEANVFVRFSFEFTEKDGWQAGAQKPLFDVQHLKYSLVGNNVPMPTSLIRAILRGAIPGLIQRRLQAVLPRELGTYLLRAHAGVAVRASADCVGVPLATLDADLGFEVRGPSRGAKEAARQQRRLAAAREARRLLGLGLPQAQALGRLWREVLGAGGGLSALTETEVPAAVPPHASRHLSISALVAFVATHTQQPHVYDALCRTLTAGWAVLQRAEPSLGPFDVRAFLDGPLAEVRRKPARARVVVTALEAGLNLDALLAAMHDYTRRTLEELFVNGPLPNASDGDADGATPESIQAQFDLLRAWHAWVSREMSHFKAKFCGAAATLLGAANHRAFTLGVENGSYEGALRLRLPVRMDVDADGALSFECPLPSPEGKIGEFMDVFKSLTVPSHLRPPTAAVNWIPLSGEPEMDMAMREQVARGVGLIVDVLGQLAQKMPIIDDGKASLYRGGLWGAADNDEPAATALSNPKTLLGSRLGRFIVNRLSVRVRLDERRIGQILKGMDASTMGDQFLPTAAGILGALGDVASVHFCPAVPSRASMGEGGTEAPSAYLLAAESSDISRLRTDVQSLGYQSGISPAGAVRLVHALGRASLISFKGVDENALDAYTSKMEGLYGLFSREGLDVSLCWNVKAAVEKGDVIIRIGGRADDAAVRETSPLVVVTDLDLVPLGKAMRGDPPAHSAAASTSAPRVPR